MRVLMLGWEFPPFIAGGLGVACYGLTKALDRLGHEVIFVLPKPVDRSHTSHVKMLSPSGRVVRAAGNGASTSTGGDVVDLIDDAGIPLFGFQHTTFRGVPATFSSPYPGFDPANFVSLTGGKAGSGALNRYRDTLGMERFQNGTDLVFRCRKRDARCFARCTRFIAAILFELVGEGFDGCRHANSPFS